MTGQKTPDLKPIPFWEMVGFMEKRGVVMPDIYYGQLMGIQRANSFSVAGISAYRQLTRIRDSLVEAISNGTTFEAWKAKVMKGELKLNLPEWRHEVIYRTNIQSMYNRGRLAEQRQNAEYEPYLKYDAVGDSRTRPTHMEMDGVIRHIDDPWWKTHAPSNGYNCRCNTIALSEDEMLEQGGQTPSLPGVQPDKDWDYSTLMQPHRGIQKSVERIMKDAPEMKKFLPKAPPTLKEIQKLGKQKHNEYQRFFKSEITRMEKAFKPKPLTELDRALINRRAHLNFLEKFKSEKGGRAFTKIAGFTNNKNGKLGAGAIKEASEYYPSDWIIKAETARTGLRVGNSTKRGYYLSSDKVRFPDLFDKRKSVQKAIKDGYDIIEGYWASNHTMVHEFGHFLQRCFPDLQAYFVQVHNKRTVGESLKKISRGEYAKRDKYPNWYFGKEYQRGENSEPLELLTMVFESILSKDSIFSKETLGWGKKTFDKELAELAFGLLYGWNP